MNQGLTPSNKKRPFYFGQGDFMSERKINASNARTQCIEIAVEMLSKRDSITMTDVREFMDDLVSTKIVGGKDEDGNDKFIPISKIYKYKADEVEILSRAEAGIINNHDFTLELKKDVKLSDWLKELKDRGFFVAREDIPKFVAWALRFARDIQNTCEKGEVQTHGFDTAQNLQMQFNSVVKGCGKSYFAEHLVNGANALGMRGEYEVPMPKDRRFGTSDVESKCLVVGYQEHKPSSQKISEDTIMQIGRRAMYNVEEKGKDVKKLQARAITIGSSNGFPYCNDRSMTIIRCNPLKWPDYPEEIRKRAEGRGTKNTTIYKLKPQIPWLSNFTNDLLTKDEFQVYLNEKDEESPEKKALLQVLSSYDISHLLVEILDTVPAEDLCAISVAGLSAFYKSKTGEKLSYPQKAKIAELLTILYSKNLIQKTNYESNDVYKKYNLFSLHDIKMANLSKEGVVTAVQEVEMAQKTWADVIALAEKYENENPDGNPPKKEVEEETPAPTPEEPKAPESKEESTQSSDIDEINAFYAGLFDETPAPESNSFLKETEETLSTKGDRYWFKKHEHAMGCTDNTATFVVSNRVSEESIKKFQGGELPGIDEPAKMLARGEYLEQNNFVFECDEASLEEQKAMIENLPEDMKKCICWVVFSGARSLHLVLRTNNTEPEFRKAIWEYINQKYFHGKGDGQCHNASRLTPNPNALRFREGKPQHDGAKQQCFYMNRNPAEYDVSSIVAPIRAERKKEEMMRELRKLTAPKDYKKKELTVETLKSRRQTPARDYAISLLEGTMSHGPDAISGLKYMLGTGFDEWEVRTAVPLDTWTEKEFDAMIKAAMKNL